MDFVNIKNAVPANGDVVLLREHDGSLSLVKWVEDRVHVKKLKRWDQETQTFLSPCEYTRLDRYGIPIAGGVPIAQGEVPGEATHIEEALVMEWMFIQPGI